MLGFVQIGGGEGRPDADHKLNRDVLRRISHALDRGLDAARDGQDRSLRSSRSWKFWSTSDPFRSSDVVGLRVDPTGDGRGSALSAPSSSSTNLAWNAFSNCRTSAMFNEFLAGRIRRAQMAAASAELTSLSSPMSWSRNTADNWLFKRAFAELTCFFCSAIGWNFRPKWFRPPLSGPRSAVAP